MFSTSSRICDLVQQALAIGFLSLEAENFLRHLLCAPYDRADLKAFLQLQEAVASGRVKQESRELRKTQITRNSA
ncbi:hypothetical protein H6G20_10725 [Desertifilum sp. FACHB-1129]|uniref:Uncharacterized protein n=2 Tax=Desertifilum tharense IPPAS B-1220 TaxID=1781255 RepID=A0A1E5QCS4_9CYAN|nr:MULTISPECIES: hypothetical protein [Desertifilum]MDA0211628.1 hypothetical protein [Cyanobacteria bacterium FC1]MBD2312135.1 hypothetical protein [Desertifilum sp. FACHB-1129]MBD2322203.1 hypothetical protein [Desertifilum sp. FACHB-866]MBD2332240.1 hypothetical protein [Desertifilum sp. FACHB-868]OEJ72401.1 hypothetical protein BH720_25325 [Desertifilum tharense IPPAS B-1220]